MGTEVRVVGGSHYRIDPDTGEPETVETGDVFEATDEELEAFGDKFEPVNGEDEWSPTRGGGPEPEGPVPGTYRLVRGGQHRLGRDDEGIEIVLDEGDETHLSASEVEAFGDKFDLVEPDPEYADVDEDESEDTSQTVTVEDAAEASDETEAESEDVDEQDEGEDAEAEDEGPPPIPPGAVLDAMDYRGEGSVQQLAIAHGIDDSQQAKEDLVEYLLDRRGAEGVPTISADEVEWYEAEDEASEGE